MRFDWKALLADGTDVHPGELRSVWVGFDGEGTHVHGMALVAETDAELVDIVGGPCWYEIDARPLDGDQDLELHVPPTPCSSLDEGVATVERLLELHNAVQQATIQPG